MEEHNKHTGIWTRNFTLLFASHMISASGVYLVNTLLPLYSRLMGATDTLIGVVASAFSLIALASRPFSGPAIDAFNKKLLFILLSFGNAVCMLGYSFAPSLAWIIFFRMVHGITYGSQASLCLAMTSGSLPKEKLTSGVATYTLSNVLPQALAPGIGLSLSDTYGFRVVYLISGLLIAASACMGFLMDYNDHESKPYRINTKSIFAVEAAVPVLILFLTSFAASATQSFLVLHVNDSGVEGLSYYYTVTVVCLVLFRPLAGTLSDRYGIRNVVVPCLLIYSCFFLLLSSVSSKWELWLCAVLHAAGFSSAHILLQALVMKSTPAARRGAASSSCYFGYDGGALVGGVINGRIAEAIGYSSLFRVCIIPVICSVAIILLWTGRKQAPADPGADAA